MGKQTANMQLTASQFDTIYNVTSFGLACMMASTAFFFLRLGSMTERYKEALCYTGLVTFIAFFNAYRYMDWLLTVPLLLIEIVLVMKLSPEESATQCRNLGVLSALMIILGYPGELIMDEENLGTRFVFWFLAMVPFVFIVYTLLVGLQGAINAESDPVMKSKVNAACVWTVISWCTYPVVYLLPFLGVSGPQAVVGIQIGYCAADVISKCGVGLIIYQITNAKSQAEGLMR